VDVAKDLARQLNLAQRWLCLQHTDRLIRKLLELVDERFQRLLRRTHQPKHAHIDDLHRSRTPCAAA
jgi:hypothetical protein